MTTNEEAFKAGARTYMVKDPIARPFQERTLDRAWEDYLAEVDAPRVTLADTYVGIGEHSNVDLVMQLTVTQIKKRGTELVVRTARLSFTEEQVSKVEAEIKKFWANRSYVDTGAEDEENL